MQITNVRDSYIFDGILKCNVITGSTFSTSLQTSETPTLKQTLGKKKTLELSYFLKFNESFTDHLFASFSGDAHSCKKIASTGLEGVYLL